MSFYHVFETAFGFCGIGWTERGICRFVLPVARQNAARELLTKRLPASRATEPVGIAAAAVSACRHYFDGEREEFADVIIDLQNVDPFRHSIYEAARKVEYGRTTTYGELAVQAGFPTAARETGTAMGRNPVPLFVPCHRVLAAGGKIGGFSAPGGTATKQKMLALEQALPPHSEPRQASFAF